jgi:hypothetical protein
MRKKHSFILTIFSTEDDSKQSFRGKIQFVHEKKGFTFRGMEEFEKLVEQMVEAEITSDEIGTVDNQENYSSSKTFPDPRSFPFQPV